MSRRRVSVKELGQVDCQGWLYRRKEGKGLLGSKWKKYWFVLKKNSLYWYTCQTAEKAEGYINLADFTIEPANDCRKKHAMKAIHPQVVTVYVAADSLTEMNKWMSNLSVAVDRTQSSKQNNEDCYSEASDQDTEEVEVSSCPLYSEQMTRDSDNGDITLPSRTSSPIPESDPGSITTTENNDSLPTRQSGYRLDLPSQDGAWKGSYLPQPLLNGEMDRPEVDSQQREQESTSDEMECLFIHLKQARLSPTGQPKPTTQRDFRISFIRRCKNERINEKLHLVRILNSTLKAKEADLLAIDQVLADPTITAHMYRQWRLGHVILLQEITRHRGPAGGSRELLVQALK